MFLFVAIPNIQMTTCRLLSASFCTACNFSNVSLNKLWNRLADRRSHFYVSAANYCGWMSTWKILKCNTLLKVKAEEICNTNTSIQSHSDTHIHIHTYLHRCHLFMCGNEFVIKSFSVFFSSLFFYFVLLFKPKQTKLLQHRMEYNTYICTQTYICTHTFTNTCLYYSQGNSKQAPIPI